MKNKEYGSDFHYVNLSEFFLSPDKKSFFDSSTQFYFSGRVALRAILIHGVSKHNWKKIYLPTYYCHEVYDFIKDLDLNFEFYSSNPYCNQIPLSIIDNTSNVILLVNYFGINLPEHSHLKNIFKIEDFTHDLRAIGNSKADYVFGSLRKVLPTPVGGFVKSKETLPELYISDFSKKIIEQKSKGMLLKRNYLENGISDKKVYRELLVEAEQQFSNPETFSNLSNEILKFIEKLDINLILDLKKNNCIEAKKTLIVNDKINIISNGTSNDFALILKLNSFDEREKLRLYLITNSIYPIVLWPNQLNKEDVAIEQTLLFLHIDYRYTTDDINFITNCINQFYLNAI